MKYQDKDGPIAVATADAPQAVGPYSQALRVGDWLFCSGQIPLDPVSGEIVEGGMEVQGRRVFDNLESVLRAAGMDFRDVVKVTVYLTDLGDFTALNSVYERCFRSPYPARATVGVDALPKGARLEVELVARDARVC